jgi:hypothetical protein
MTDPITPPSKLLQQWATEYWGNPGESIGCGEKYIAIKAAQWGADQELEACCKTLDMVNGSEYWSQVLRSDRRPKPPSLKEQALEQLACIQTDLNKFGMGISTNTIRRALEALDD